MSYTKRGEYRVWPFPAIEECQVFCLRRSKGSQMECPLSLSASLVGGPLPFLFLGLRQMPDDDGIIEFD